jgi:MFS family permease
MPTIRAWPAVLCATLNAFAVVALGTVLAPGTTLVADAAMRDAYVREHAVAWRAGWSLWVAAAASLIAFYAWWAARLRRRALVIAGLGLATVGFASDLYAQWLLIRWVPERPDLAPLAFLLTGGAANGFYTLGGILLSLATPAIRGPLATWTAAMWLCGLALSASAILEVPLGIAATTAALFALFVPWCVVLGRRLA